MCIQSDNVSLTSMNCRCSFHMRVCDLYSQSFPSVYELIGKKENSLGIFECKSDNGNNTEIPTTDTPPDYHQQEHLGKSTWPQTHVKTVR